MNSAWLDKNQKTLAWATASILFILLNYLKGVTRFPWDAGQYWGLSTLTSLFTTPNEIRGYFYPLLLSPARFISDSVPALGYAPYRILSSLVYSYVFTNLLPDFYNSVFGGRLGFWRRLAVPVLLAVLFPGLIIYTLSDIPALALMLGSLASARRSAHGESSPAGRYGLLILAGLLAYGAYNTRTIYLFSVLLAIPAVAIVIYRGYPLQMKLSAISCFLIGAFIASVPQMYINAETHGTWSPAVISGSQPGSLFAEQLLWGITVQRYETTYDRPPHGPRVFYMDPAGEQLFLTEKISAASFGVGDYLGLVLRHPVDFLGIFGRHFVNGLDVRDGDSYISGKSTDRADMAFINFLVVFAGFAIICIAAVAYPPTDKQGTERYFWGFLSLLPVFAVIPGSIETRYFLPLHVGIYSAIAFNGDMALISNVCRRHWLVLLAALSLSAAVFFSVSTATMSNMQYNYPKVYQGK